MSEQRLAINDKTEELLVNITQLGNGMDRLLSQAYELKLKHAKLLRAAQEVNEWRFALLGLVNPNGKSRVTKSLAEAVQGLHDCLEEIK